MCLEVTFFSIDKNFTISYIPVKTIEEAKDIYQVIKKYNKTIMAVYYENGKRTVIEDKQNG